MVRSSMPPVPPVILFGFEPPTPPTTPRARHRPVRSVLEPRDGRPSSRGWQSRIAALRSAPRSAVEPERLAERDRHLRGARKLATPRPRTAAALDVDRYDGRPAQHRQHARPGLRLARMIPSSPRVPSGKTSSAPPSSSTRSAVRSARGIGALAPDRARVETPDERAEQGQIEQLRLGQEGQLAADARSRPAAGRGRSSGSTPAAPGPSRERARVLSLPAGTGVRQRDGRNFQKGVDPVHGRVGYRWPRAAAPALDPLEQPLHHLLDREVGRVDLDRVRRLPQRRQLARLILGVARRELGRDRLQRRWRPAPTPARPGGAAPAPRATRRGRTSPRRPGTRRCRCRAPRGPRRRSRPSRRWSGVTFVRTDASVVMREVTWATSWLRMASVTSSPSTKTRSARTTTARCAR